MVWQIAARVAARGALKAGSFATRKAIVGTTLLGAGTMALASKASASAKASTSDSSIPTNPGGMHALRNVLIFLVIGLFIFLNLPFVLTILRSIFSSILNILQFGGGVFALIDVNLISIAFLISLLLSILISVMNPQRVPAAFKALLFSWLLIILTFYVYFKLGFKYFSPDIISLLSSGFSEITMYVIILLFYVGFIFSVDPDKTISKFFTFLLVALGLVWGILFFISGSQEAVSIQTGVDNELDKASNSISSFNRHWKCDVMGGKIRGDPDCIDVVEEVEVEKISVEPLYFKLREDSVTSVVHKNRPDARFIFDIDPPKEIDVMLSNYSCKASSGEKIVYPIPSKYQEFTTSPIPDSGIPLALECPVYNNTKKTVSNPTVKIEVLFKVEDRIIQRIPYIDCQDDFFDESGILCGNLAREYWRGNIQDPEVNSVLTTLSDSVYGGYSVDAKVKGLRGNMPFYLNSDEIFALDSYTYSVEFNEDSILNLKIDSIQVDIENIRTPNYVKMLNNFGNEFKKKSVTEISVPVPFEFEIVDFDSDFIGSSENLIIPYTIHHIYVASRKVNIIRDEEEESIEKNLGDDVLVGSQGNDSLNQEVTQTTTGTVEKTVSEEDSDVVFNAEVKPTEGTTLDDSGASIDEGLNLGP